MPNRQLFVPARYYARLAELMATQGVDVNAVLRDLKLPTSFLTEADAQLSWQQVEELLAEIRLRSGRTDLGFELGRLLTVSAHSFVGFGMLNCPNVEQAFCFVARYFRLVMPSFRLRYVSGEDFGELQFSATTAMSHECLVFHSEAIGMAALREVRDLANDPLLDARLELAIPTPLHASRYRSIPHLSTHFESEIGVSARLRVHANLRALQLVAADKSALRVAEERCRLLVQKATTVGEFGEFIAMLLNESGDGGPSQAEVATMLNISKRTLNRHLEREKTSFREITRRVQHNLARERLRSGQMSVSAIAYSLGFSDVANFTRAFRSLEGCPPTDYKRGIERSTSTELMGLQTNSSDGESEPRQQRPSG